MTKYFVMSAALICFMVGCTFDERRQGQPQPDCDISDGASAVAQPLVRLFAFIAFVLPEELGGLRCVPGNGDACQDARDGCVGEFGDVATAESRSADIQIDNDSPINLRITSISLFNITCEAFSLVEPVPQEINSDGSDSVTLSFLPTVAGPCSARLEVISDAGNATDTDGRSFITLFGNGID